MNANNEMHRHQWLPMSSYKGDAGNGKRFIQYNDQCAVCQKPRSGRVLLDTDRMRAGL